MSNVNKLAVKITGDESGLKKASKEATKDIQSVNNAALSFKGMLGASALGNILGNTVSKAFSAINQEMDGAIERLDAINNYSKVMAGLGVTAEDSETSIALLRQGLEGLPTNLTDAIAGVKRLTATNGNIQASTEMFLALNNAVLAGGSSIEMQQSALEQLNQAYAKGKPEMQDWKILLQAMPAQLKQVAQAMGYASSSDLYQAFQDGTASMNDFMVTMMQLNKTGGANFASFAEQARNATGGIQTAMITLKYTVQNGLATIVNEIGSANIAGLFAGIGNAIATVANYVAAFIRIIKEAVAWLGALFGFGGSGDTSGIVKATAGASEALAGGADSAGGIASGLNDAAGSAKKLRQQLAGFDEMNVLQDKDTGAGGGGAGGGAGGGGVGALTDFSWDTSGLAKAEDKIAEIANKIKKFFKEAFGEWDFDKIGKSLQKFVGQVQKFLQPIGDILGDIWNLYLKPLVTWAGNDLLPAFLNALGGALEFLGAIIGTIWNSILEPFITNFIKPIAEFTGGIIVTVLNGIGTALGLIGGNQDAVNVISSIVTSVGVLLGYNIVAGFLTGLINSLGILNTTFTALPIALGSTTAGFNAFTKSGSVAANLVNTIGGGTAGLINKMTGAVAGTQAFVSTLGGLCIALEAAILVYEAFNLAQEYGKLKEMEASAAASEYNAKIFDQTESIVENNNAIQAQIDLKNELLGIEKTLADQSLALLTAQDNLSIAQANADAVAAKYGLTTDQAREMVQGLDIASGNLTEQERELADAIFDLESKEGSLRSAQDKVSESKDKQSEASQQLYNQALKEYGMAQLSEMQAKINEGRYNEVADALLNMRDAEIIYTDEAGRQHQIASQDVKDYTDWVGDLLGQMDTEQSRAWKNIWTSAEYTTDNIKGALNDLSASAQANGAAIPAGIQNGIASGQSGVLGVIGSLATRISSTFKNILGIASPSKVFAESGKWIDAGLTAGIEDNQDDAIKAASNMGNAIVTAFNEAPKFADLGVPDLNTEFDRLTAKAQATVDIQNEATNSAIDSLATAITRLAEQDNRVTVKIGEETIIDRVIEGINGASTMKNRNVINL